MGNVKLAKTEKKSEKTIINPSKRINPQVKIKQIQQGILEYKDEIGTVLIGIETRDKEQWESHFSIEKPRELSHAQWDVSRTFSVGNRVMLSPRDIHIFKELIKYLKEQGIEIGI